MSKFIEVYNVQPVNEGWGTALLQIGYWTNLFAGLGGFAAGVIPVGMICTGTAIAIAMKNGKQMEISDSMIDKLLNTPKLKKYIVHECDSAWKNVNSKYKGSKWKLSKTISHDCWDSSTEDDGAKGSNKLSGVTNYTSYHKIGGYIIKIYADSDHIDGIKVCFQMKSTYPEDQSIDPYKLLEFTLPSPTRDDIKAMGYRKE